MRDRPLYYVLDANRIAQPSDMVASGICRDDMSVSRVGSTEVGDVEVSTIFLGTDHAHRGAPMLFETLITGGQRDGAGVRYSTWVDAEAGHALWVGMIKADAGVAQDAVAPYTPPGFLYSRHLEDGRLVGVMPLIYGGGLVGISSKESLTAEDWVDQGFDDEWQYEFLGEAIVGVALWDPLLQPEPAGWYRHPRTGRRRRNGDPASEFVML